MFMWIPDDRRVHAAAMLLLSGTFILAVLFAATPAIVSAVEQNAIGYEGFHFDEGDLVGYFINRTDSPLQGVAVSIFAMDAQSEQPIWMRRVELGDMQPQEKVEIAVHYGRSRQRPDRFEFDFTSAEDVLAGEHGEDARRVAVRDGQGVVLTSPFAAPAGNLLFLYRYEPNSDGAFVIRVMDSETGDVDTLVEIDATAGRLVQGSYEASISQDRMLSLDIAADGPWRIRVVQPPDNAAPQRGIRIEEGDDGALVITQ